MSLSSSKPIRRRSKKKSDEYELRRPLVARLLKERPTCEACPRFAAHDGALIYRARPSRDIHELVRRSQGGSILDEDNLMAVCGPCHQRITEYRDGRAVLEGLGLWRPSYYKPD